MKKEVELKFRVHNFAPLRKKLRSLGAKLIWRGREENWYFDTKSRALHRRNVALRIKTMGDTRLTLKENMREKGGIKIAYEYQLGIDNAWMMGEVLKRLGFSLAVYYRKYRELWKMPAAEILLDKLSSQLQFVEIEAGRDKIKKLAKKLGLDFTKSTAKTYIQLLEESKRK